MFYANLAFPAIHPIASTCYHVQVPTVMLRGHAQLIQALLLFSHRLLLLKSNASDVTLKLVVLVVERSHEVLRVLVVVLHLLKGVRVRGRQNLALVGHAVLVVKAALDLRRGGEVLVADCVGEAVAAKAEAAVAKAAQEGKDEEHAHPVISLVVASSVGRGCEVAQGIAICVVHSHALSPVFRPARNENAPGHVVEGANCEDMWM